MPFTLRAVTLLLALLSDACGDKLVAKHARPAPDWIRVHACPPQGFAFYAPADLSETPMGGTDSCVGRYTSGDCVFQFDYGAFSERHTRYADQPGYDVAAIEVQHAAGTLTTFGPTARGIHWAGLYVARTGPEQISLSLYASCKSAAGRQTAVQALKTVTFPRAARR